LKDIIWNNQFLKIEAKTRIYKSCVRLIITYAAETTADTSRTKSITRTAEMRTLRGITGHTLLDRIPNQEIRRTYRTFNQHINRMEERETENHTLEDRQADHQRGGGIAGCRRRKKLHKAGKTF